MEFDVLTKILHRQQSVSRETDGAEARVRGSRTGQLNTVNWKQDLVAQGKVWRVSVGGMSAGGDVALITGGGAGTTIDSDQPEIAIGVDSGYFLIPLRVQVACRVDVDADTEVGDILVVADRTQGVPTSVTGTVETPDNQLDGGASFPGRAFSAITADITDPVDSEVLAYKTIREADVTAAGSIIAQLDLDYNPDFADLIAGPCGLYVMWGGTAAVSAVCNVIVAAVESSYFA